MRGDFSRVSPIDREGAWFDAGLAVVAEKFFRVKFGRPARERPKPPSHAEAVRANWREIPWPELTEPERALAGPEMDRMMAKARANIARGAAKWRAAFRDKHTRFDAGPLPPERPKPIYVDVPPAELMARFGGYATESEAE